MTQQHILVTCKSQNVSFIKRKNIKYDLRTNRPLEYLKINTKVYGNIHQSFDANCGSCGTIMTIININAVLHNNNVQTILRNVFKSWKGVSFTKPWAVALFF